MSWLEDFAEGFAEGFVPVYSNRMARKEENDREDLRLRQVKWEETQKERNEERKRVKQAEALASQFGVDPGMVIQQMDIYGDAGEVSKVLTEALKAGAIVPIKPKEADRPSGDFMGPMPVERASATSTATPYDIPTASADGNITLSAIRKFEGFRETPYWDINAFRVGYGSDTITKPDGTVVRVTEGMTVTREDAERDLARRSEEFANTAANQVGPDVWAKLPETARAALTSVAYNYGSLPDRIIDDVRSGDTNAIAGAILSLSGDNDGINARRRATEAAMIRGMDSPDPTDNQMASLLGVNKAEDNRRTTAKFDEYLKSVGEFEDYYSGDVPAVPQATSRIDYTVLAQGGGLDLTALAGKSPDEIDQILIANQKTILPSQMDSILAIRELATNPNYTDADLAKMEYGDLLALGAFAQDPELRTRIMTAAEAKKKDTAGSEVLDPKKLALDAYMKTSEFKELQAAGDQNAIQLALTDWDANYEATTKGGSQVGGGGVEIKLIPRNVPTEQIIAQGGAQSVFVESRRNPQTGQMEYVDTATGQAVDTSKFLVGEITEEERKARTALTVQLQQPIKDYQDSRRSLLGFADITYDMATVLNTNPAAATKVAGLVANLTSLGREASTAASILSGEFGKDPAKTFSEEELNVVLQQNGFLKKGETLEGLAREYSAGEIFSEEFTDLAEASRIFEAKMVLATFRAGGLEGQTGVGFSNQDFQRLSTFMNSAKTPEQFHRSVGEYLAVGLRNVEQIERDLLSNPAVTSHISTYYRNPFDIPTVAQVVQGQKRYQDALGFFLRPYNAQATQTAPEQTTAPTGGKVVTEAMAAQNPALSALVGKTVRPVPDGKGGFTLEEVK